MTSWLRCNKNLSRPWRPLLRSMLLPVALLGWLQWWLGMIWQRWQRGLWTPLLWALLAWLWGELSNVRWRSLVLRDRIRLVRGLPFERSGYGYLGGWWLRRMSGFLSIVWSLKNIRRGWCGGCRLSRLRRESGKTLWWLQDRRGSTGWSGRHLRSSCFGNLCWL